MTFRETDLLRRGCAGTLSSLCGWALISASEDLATVVRLFHLLVCGVWNVEGADGRADGKLNSSLTSDVLMTTLPSCLVDVPTLLFIFLLYLLSWYS